MCCPDIFLRCVGFELAMDVVGEKGEMGIGIGVP